MKRYRVIPFIVMCLMLLPVGNVFADDDPDGYGDIVDIVYEWSPEGNAIQVGDYAISDFGEVWSDTGDGKLVMVGRSSIKVGELVRVVLVDKDEHGIWLADRVIVLSGLGLDKAMASLDAPKRKQVKESQQNSVEDEKSVVRRPARSSEQPVFRDGVWQN